MALPKKAVPKDRPEVIATRERMKPVDETQVVAKLADGTLVIPLSGGMTYNWGTRERPDHKPFAPYVGQIQDSVKKALKEGIAERFVFRWVNSDDRRLAHAQGMPRWTTVKKGSNEVFVPYAHGQQTDGLYHMADTILHKRDRAIDEQIQSDKEYYNNPHRIMAERDAEMNETLGHLGAKKIKQTFEAAHEDAVTHTDKVD